MIRTKNFKKPRRGRTRLISNNSWNYGDSSYNLAAASYDAAVRDALPEVTGSQPVLFVFSAGNGGGGNNDGGGGNPEYHPVAGHGQKRDYRGGIGAVAQHHQQCHQC